MDNEALSQRLADGHPMVDDEGRDLPECSMMFGPSATEPHHWTGAATITAHYRCPKCGTEWQTDWNREYAEHGFTGERPSDGVSVELEINDVGTITEVEPEEGRYQP